MSDYKALKSTKEARPSNKDKNTTWLWLLAAFAVLIMIGVATS